MSEEEKVLPEEVVLSQEDLDENPILAEAGLEVGDVGEVVDAPSEEASAE